MPPWVKRQVIDVDLDQSPDERLARMPDELIEHAKTLLAAVLDGVPGHALYLADLIRLRIANRFQEEAVAIAKRAEIDWQTVMLANVSYDLTLTMFSCSTIALATPDGPVLARNMDWWPEDLLARATYQFSHQRNGEVVYTTGGWPGAIGVVTGMSSRGFAMALNAVIGPDGVDKTGYPVLLQLRCVLEDATDFDHALTMLRDTKLAAPGLITLIGRQNNQRVVIERSPRKHALRYPDHEDQPLVATNDYRMLFKPQTHQGLEIYETTCSRFANLNDLCADLPKGAALDDAALLYVLSDPGVLAQITAQQIVMRPRLQRMNTYVPRRLLDESASSLFELDRTRLRLKSPF